MINRDNHLGRQINQWIEEDLRAIEKQHQQMLANSDDGSHHNINLPAELSLHDTDPHLAAEKLISMETAREVSHHMSHTTPHKKRKPNSSKEGTVPAYVNVELVHPSLDLLKPRVDGLPHPEGNL
jgi:hypothetical protein